MDISEWGLAISMISISIAVLKINRKNNNNGKLKSIDVQKAIDERPTFRDTDRRYKKIEVCDEMHKSVDEKLDCIPEIKDTVVRLETKMDILLKSNGH